MLWQRNGATIAIILMLVFPFILCLSLDFTLRLTMAITINGAAACPFFSKGVKIKQHLTQAFAQVSSFAAGLREQNCVKSLSVF